MYYRTTIVIRHSVSKSVLSNFIIRARILLYRPRPLLLGLHWATTLGLRNQIITSRVHQRRTTLSHRRLFQRCFMAPCCDELRYFIGERWRNEYKLTTLPHSLRSIPRRTNTLFILSPRCGEHREVLHPNVSLV